LSNAHWRGMPTRTTTSSFATSSAGQSTRRRSATGSGRHREAAGIPVGSLHTLRHTAATLMLVNGIPVHVAAARLGDDPRTVLDRYAHLLPQSDSEAAERLAGLLAG
jgi:integrase